MKRYIEIENKNRYATHIKIETYYSLGGYNYFTGKTEPRGYYLSVSPVERQITDYGAITESYTAFSGIKQCVKEVSRKSAKAEIQAESAAVEYIPALVIHVCDKNGLAIPAEIKAVGWA